MMKKTVLMAMMMIVMGTTLMAASSHYDALPSHYWEHPVATMDDKKTHKDISLTDNMRPEACAQCHQEQFNIWRNSRHAAAYSPGMVGQFPSMGHAAGNDCLVCHAPLAEQLYRSANDMNATLKLLLQHPQGFSRDADLDSKAAALPLRHAGVTCAVCHVRKGQRFGPPRRGSDVLGKLEGDAHHGFVAIKNFEKSSLCASCHQFPQAYAINGKPLENTVFEWQKSDFARKGIQCQTCHMPNREHAFKGIHDKNMVKRGLNFKLEKQGVLAVLKITSTYIGHAFPTYVTPKVIIRAQAMNAQGKVLQHWKWDMMREVVYDNGWKELRDSRLMPNQSRVFITDGLSRDAVSVMFSVDVIPDFFYKGVYRNLLSGEMQLQAKKLIKKALTDANKNDYQLYECKLKL
jgi:Zn-finger protein